MGNCGSKKPKVVESTPNQNTLNFSLQPPETSQFNTGYDPTTVSLNPAPGSVYSFKDDNLDSRRNSKFHPANPDEIRFSVAPSVVSSYAETEDMRSIYSDAFMNKSPSVINSSNTAHVVPPNCPIVEQLQLVDSVRIVNGIEHMRCESLEYGLILAKVLSEPTQRSTEELENELKLLSFLQKGRSEKKGDYRSRGPLRTGYGSNVLKFQHDNVIGFIGYMEGPDLSNKMARMLLQEYYIDSLRDHIEHRTHVGKHDMKHYETSLYAFQAAKGLQEITKKKICHRDLNTDNIVMGLGLLDRDYKDWLKLVAKEETKRNIEKFSQGTSRQDKYPGHQPPQNQHYYKFLHTLPLVAKIANFGNAKRIIVGRTSTKIGSIQFMAPEMMVGHEYSHGVDVWSFGCVMYEMITGRAPFNKKPQNYIESKITKNNFPRQDRIGGSRFRTLEIIMRECLRTDPSERCKPKKLVKSLGSSLILHN